MMRQENPPTPSPDTALFVAADYALPPLGVCAPCLAEVSTTAANTARIAAPPAGQSLAGDVEGCRIITPRGHSLIWQSGAELPVDAHFVADAVRLFGESIRLTSAIGQPLPMIAVTAVGGTLMCAIHAAWEIGSDEKARRARGGRL